MNLSRRQILASMGLAGLSAAGLYASSPFFQKQGHKGFILGGGMGANNGKKVYFLSVIDLDSPQPSPRFIPLDFLAHGLSFHPTNPFLLTTFEKKGPGACEIDLSTGEKRTINTVKSRYFYGHGAYINNGGQLLSTETVLETGEGLIVIRNGKTLQIEGQFPSYGANPHDCQLLDDGKVIAITNGGAAYGKTPLPSVTYVDIASQKLIKKYEIEDPKFNTGHLAISNNLDLAVSSAPRLGLPEDNNGSLSLLSKEGQLTTLKEPQNIVAQLKSETLSLCIDNKRNILAATSPAGNIVTFWKMKTGEFIKSISLPNPRGIVQSADKKYFLVSYSRKADLAFIQSESLQLESDDTIFKAGFSGSHLYMLDL